MRFFLQHRKSTFFVVVTASIHNWIRSFYKMHTIKENIVIISIAGYAA